MEAQKTSASEKVNDDSRQSPTRATTRSIGGRNWGVVTERAFGYTPVIAHPVEDPREPWAKQGIRALRRRLRKQGSHQLSTQRTYTALGLKRADMPVTTT